MYTYSVLTYYPHQKVSTHSSNNISGLDNTEILQYNITFTKHFKYQQTHSDNNNLRHSSLYLE